MLCSPLKDPYNREIKNRGWNLKAVTSFFKIDITKCFFPKNVICSKDMRDVTLWFNVFIMADANYINPTLCFVSSSDRPMIYGLLLFLAFPVTLINILKFSIPHDFKLRPLCSSWPSAQLLLFLFCVLQCDLLCLAMVVLDYSTIIVTENFLLSIKLSTVDALLQGENLASTGEKNYC